MNKKDYTIKEHALYLLSERNLTQLANVLIHLNLYHDCRDEYFNAFAQKTDEAFQILESKLSQLLY